MKRISRKKDSKREENSPAERFSEIIFFEPALKAADEKSSRSPALWAFERIIRKTFSRGGVRIIKLGGTASYLRPFYWDEGFFIFRRYIYE